MHAPVVQANGVQWDGGQVHKREVLQAEEVVAGVLQFHADRQRSTISSNDNDEPAFDAATAPGIDRMADYLCACAYEGTCAANALCARTGLSMDYFFRLCTHWCGLLTETCSGVFFASADASATPARLDHQCVLGTIACTYEPDAFLNKFSYASLAELRRCGSFASPTCMDGSSTLELAVCSAEDQRGRRRLQFDEVLLELEGVSEEFESDVLLEGMDVPVADT